MPAITIERIEAIPLRIPMDHWAPPPLFAGRPRTTIDTLMVRVATNRGVVGWGEAYGGGWQATVAALDHWVSPLALGQDATDVALTSRLERALRARRARDPCHQRARHRLMGPARQARRRGRACAPRRSPATARRSLCILVELRRLGRARAAQRGACARARLPPDQAA